MNNLQTSFPAILDFASQTNTPLTKPRAIIREYLQSMAVTTLYSLPQSEKLSFVGGTSLRLLRGIDRFSEDLDFDNLGLSPAQVEELVHAIEIRFSRENIDVELYQSDHGERNYFELRFPHILHDLKISTNEKEKLMIKVDYSSSWKGQVPEIVLFNRYGFLERIVTNPRNQLLVQKLASYVQRKQTQPRDIYDIVWLYGQGARFDVNFARENEIGSIVKQAFEKFEREGISKVLEARLQPFLFSEQSIARLNLFGDVLTSLQSI